MVCAFLLELGGSMVFAVLSAWSGRSALDRFVAFRVAPLVELDGFRGVAILLAWSAWSALGPFFAACCSQEDKEAGPVDSAFGDSFSALWVASAAVLFCRNKRGAPFSPLRSVAFRHDAHTYWHRDPTRGAIVYMAFSP